MGSKILKALFVGLAIVLLVTVGLAMGRNLVLAHGAVPEWAEVWTGEARLFTADNARSEILAIDLPDGQVTARIGVPPKTMILALSPDHAYVVAIRGRDVDRQHVSVIASGVEDDGFHRPYIAKTLLLGKAIGGAHGGHLGEMWGKLFLTAESDGKVYRFEAKALEARSAFVPEVLDLGAPDHYDFMPMDDGVWVGALRTGAVRLLNREGKELMRHPCPVFHGMTYDAQTRRAFFACAKDVLVVEDQQIKARIPYPISERIGAFIETAAGFFGTSEGVTNLQRLDPVAMTLTPIPLKSTLMAHGTTEDGKFLFTLLQNGMLEVREGQRGELVRTIQLGPSLPEMEEDVSGAIMPSIVAHGDHLYVSLPHRGLIMDVDWQKGKVVRKLLVGGMPTRLVLVKAKTE